MNGGCLQMNGGCSRIYKVLLSVYVRNRYNIIMVIMAVLNRSFFTEMYFNLLVRLSDFRFSTLLFLRYQLLLGF